MTPPVLAVEKLVLARQDRILSRPLTFNVLRGEAVHLSGPNGSGKTTLLDTLSTLTPLQSGHIYWQGKTPAEFGDELRALWHYCGHIDALKREWTLLENLQWQARLIGAELSIALVKTVLDQMALRALAQVPVGQFSKGQQRRAALLRLQLFSRSVWLLDEPFSALDSEGAQRLVSWMNQHLLEGGSVIFTTHQSYPALEVPPTALFLGKNRS